MRIGTRTSLALSAALAFVASGAAAATYGELSARTNGAAPGYPFNPAGPYAPAPAPTSCPPNCVAPVPQFSGGPEGLPPGAAAGPNIYDSLSNYGTAPRTYLPIDNYGSVPHGQLNLWTFGQVNSTTDPFNPWGLSTPYMFVPWSTPLSGWANAQTWNWWRERSGALPRNW